MISFPFKAELYFIVCTHHILFIHLSLDGHLGGFHPLAVVSNASVNTSVQISVHIPAFTPLRYTPRSEISGSDGVCFTLFEKPPYCFHSFLMYSCGEMYPYVSQTQSPPRNKNRSVPEVELHRQVERKGWHYSKFTSCFSSS